MNTKIKAWVRLLSIRDIGVATAQKLVEALGEPESFVGRGFEPLAGIDFVAPEIKAEIARSEDPPDWAHTVQLIEKYDIRFISLLDEDYPSLLKAIYSPPPFLFYRGTWRRESFRRTLAIVGTRKATHYGKDIAARFTHELVRAGFTIVSGLAYGIDAIAHRTTLEEGGTTIAVMGTGCETIYPDSHRELAEQIMETGCLVSEFVPGSEATKGNFPRRNRIISGLSLGTFVVEGNCKSGALITSKYAVDQNRSVFALPGDIVREQSEGPNQLIKLGAKPVTNVTDILEEFNLAELAEEQTQVFPELTAAEETIYNLLIEHRPEIDFDSLYMKAGMSFSELSTVLLGLDLKSVIRRLPGNKIAPAY